MVLSIPRLLVLCGLVFLLAGCLRKEEMKVLYAQRCLGCYGPSGKGDGPIAASLPVPLPDFRDTVRRKNVIQIRRVIKQGKGIMPAFEPALRKYEIQDMVRFVRILSMEGRTIDWWERFEPLVWAHCSVPWQYVFDYDGLKKEETGP
ncbi:MAG: c-type cytochrome [Candidatus Binatia bacterium]